MLPPGPSSDDMDRISDEEALRRLRAHMLGHADLLGVLSERVARRRQVFAKREVEFAEVQALTAKAKAIYEREMAEKKQVVAQHGLLLDDHKQLQLRASTLEEKLQQSERTVLDLTSQNNELTQSISQKDFQIDDLKKLCAEREQQAQEAAAKLAEVEACHEGIEKENSLLKETLANECQASSTHLSGINWLLQKGIPGLLRIFLTSDEFVNRNTSLQEESVRLGQYQGCLDTHGSYPDILAEKKLVYNFPTAERSVSDLFADLVTPNYDLIQSFEKGLVTLDELKNIVAGLPSGPEDIGDSSSRPE